MMDIDQTALETSLDRLVYLPDETVKLTLRYTNRGPDEQPILVAYRTPNGNHYDQLRITIQDMASTEHWTVYPIDARKAVEPFGCIVGPDAVLTQTLDLTYWSDRNGIRLTPGDYSVIVTYQTDASTKPVHHLSLCTPLLGGESHAGTRDGAMLDCATGPIRSEPITLRLIAR